MKEILEELKGSISGVIGSFVVGEKGEVLAKDVPSIMAGPVDKVSKTLRHVTDVIKSTKSVDKIIVDSDNAKLISIPVEGRIVGVIAEKNINQPLFKLMSNMAIAKIKEAPAPEAAPKAPAFDSTGVCDVYEKIFEAAAKRLTNIIGPKSALHFSEGAEQIRSSYPNLFKEIEFGRDGKPDMAVIRERARKFSEKDALIDALDELLLSMLDTVKKISGAKQEQKAMDEIQKIRTENAQEL